MERLFLDFLNLPPRSHKPRTKGFTIIKEEGFPIDWLKGMLEAYGEYVDFIKFTTAQLLPWRLIEQRVQLYRDFGVNVALDDPTFATAYYQGKAEQLLHAVRDVGLTHVQVDTHHMPITDKEKARRADEDELRYMSMARELGLKLLGEVGQKWPEGDRARAADGLLNVEGIVAEIRRLVAAGCEHVYLECRVIREAIGDYGEREQGTRQIRRIVEAVGPENIVIEITAQLPFDTRMCHRFWAVRNFGPDVNMGGGEVFEEIRFIESIRRGFMFVNGPSKSSSMLWVKSLAKNGGMKVSEEWWREDYPIDPNWRRPIS
jgi:phosphosulfolactate synthase